MSEQEVTIDEYHPSNMIGSSKGHKLEPTISTYLVLSLTLKCLTLPTSLATLFSVSLAMAPGLPFLLILLSLLPSTPIAYSLSAPTTSPAISPSPPIPNPPFSLSTTLDPKQVTALHSLNIATSKDPCSQPSLHNATSCDDSKPFSHLLSLRLANCSDDVEMSITALKSLSTLTDLEFMDCPITPIRFPSELTSNLRSFACINSLRKLTGVWLSRFQNLTDLTVSGVTVNASGPWIILGNMKKIESVTISNSNLTGYLPKHWHLNLTHINLSGNKLIGSIPSSLTLLENLELLNLSWNAINGMIPTSLGNLWSLQKLSLASNSLSGPIPDSMAAIPALEHLDLGSNQLNGTIPKFISEMKELKYLNLEMNNFSGVMPFNASFIERLIVFRVGGNSNLCYNHSTISSKLKLGIAPCDKHGLPILPPPAPNSWTDGGSSGESPEDDYGIDDDDDDESKPKEEHHHGPSKAVLGVAIGLSSLVFLIVFMVLISKWCG